MRKDEFLKAVCSLAIPVALQSMLQSSFSMGLLQNSFLQQPYCFTLSILFRGQGCRLQPKFLF